MKREYKYTILNRTLKTKMDTNHYYSVEISCKCESEPRYRIISTKSFNKTNPNALIEACDWLKQMTEMYS